MIHMVGDAAYASGAFAGLPANVTITSRLRADATLYVQARAAAATKRAAPAWPPAEEGSHAAQARSDRDQPRHRIAQDDRPPPRQDRASDGPRLPLPVVRGVRPADRPSGDDPGHRQALRLRAGADLHRPRGDPRAA